MSILDQEERIQRELAAFRPRLRWDFSLCPPEVAKLLTAIHKHLYDEFLTVNWLHERFGAKRHVSDAHFKRCTKFTIHGYIENRRVLAAMWLLGVPGLDLATISYSVGYSNYRTFARAFKRQAGCAPSQYRERLFNPER